MMFEPMDIYSKEGTKVKYMNKNGYEGDREYANKFLKEGKVYTVEDIEVGGFMSYVYLKEFPSKPFNSVMFKEFLRRVR